MYGNTHFWDLYLTALVCTPAFVFGSNCDEQSILSFGSASILWEAASALPIIRSQDDQNCLEEFLGNSTSGPWWIAVRAINPPHYWAWVDYNSTEELYLRHQGCFWEFYSNRDLPHDSELNSADVTIQNCIDECKSFKYAGLHDGDKCYCGNQFGKYGPTSGCSEPCEGNQNEQCGSSGKNSIYHTDGFWGTWMDGQPNNYESNQYCGEMLVNGANYVLRDENCASSLTYACEIAGTGEPCPTRSGFGSGTYIADTGMCYYLSTSKMEWYLAQQSCNQIGGKLLIVKTSSTYDSIHPWLSATFTAEPVWVGLMRDRWTYTNGERLTYSNFASGQQPSGSTPSKKFIGVDLVAGDYVWKAYDDSSEAVELIETVVTTTTTTTTDSTSTSSTTATNPGSTSPSTTTAAPTTSSTSSATSTTTREHSTSAMGTTSSSTLLQPTSEPATGQTIAQTTSSTTVSATDTTQALGDSNSADGGIPATQASTSAGLSNTLIAIIALVCVLVVVITILVGIYIYGKCKNQGEKVRHLDLRGDAHKPDFGKLRHTNALSGSFTRWSTMGSESKSDLMNSSYQSNVSLPSSVGHHRMAGYKATT